MSAQTVTVTDAQRIAHTIRTASRWAENLERNAQHSEQQGYVQDVRTLKACARELRDIIAMLDGTEDSYIAQLLKAGE